MGTMLEWEPWQDIDLTEKFADRYQWPGIYTIRLADSVGHPIEIRRFLGDDEDGLLTIGESTNVASRMKEFANAYEGRSFKHYEGERLFLIRVKTRFGRGVYDNCRLQFTVRKLKDKAEAQKEEEKLLKGYFVKYGELPPLNANMPDKLGKEGFPEGWA